MAGPRAKSKRPTFRTRTKEGPPNGSLPWPGDRGGGGGKLGLGFKGSVPAGSKLGLLGFVFGASISLRRAYGGRGFFRLS